MKSYFAILLLTVAALHGAGCAADVNTSQAENPSAGQKSAGNSAANSVQQNETLKKEKLRVNPRESSNNDKSACLSAKLADKKLLTSQTFAVDFEPFRNACFVTFHDPEFTAPALGSEFYIYKDGKEAFKFPNQFNGVTTGCWIEGVAFEDLNGDAMTDVIVAGMCSAKTAPYSENMVYVNTGDGFTTKEDANYKLEKFKKIKDIADFVRKNQNLFF